MVTFLLKQFFLQNTMELNISAGYGVEYQDSILKPSLKYNFTDNLQGTIGGLCLFGPDEYPSSGSTGIMMRYSPTEVQLLKIEGSIILSSHAPA